MAALVATMLRRLAPAMFAALAAASGACMTDVTVTDGINPVVVTELDRVYADAADEAGIPVDLLKAIGYAQTRWENVTGTDEFDRADTSTGVMGLTQNQLTIGAALIGHNRDEVAADPELNIRAAAKLLASEAQAQGVGGSDLAQWEPVVAAWVGIADEDARRAFVRSDVFRALSTGVEARAEGGELIASLPAHPELASLVPAPLFAAGPDYAPAQWRPSPNFGSRNGAAVTHIIIHTCEGAYSGCWGWLKNSASGVSAHYVVNESGSEVTQLVRETDRAWHISAAYKCSLNGNVDCGKNGVSTNNFSVGIEHAGFGNQASWSAGLIETSAKLVCDITRDRNIPRDRFHIVGHGQLQPANRTDPGPNWPWAHYLDLVRGACSDTTTPPPPTPTDPTPPPPTAPGASIIVDSNQSNNDASKARIEVSGWTSASATAGYYGSGYWYADTGSASGAAFFFFLPAAQSRAVDAWWTAGSNRTASATFVATNAGGAEVGRRTVSQQSSGSQWVNLGSWQFSAGWNKVTLARTGTSGKVVIADAIRVR